MDEWMDGRTDGLLLLLVVVVVVVLRFVSDFRLLNFNPLPHGEGGA
jgi:hypothetical protein